jgi:hypothetical protein
MVKLPSREDLGALPSARTGRAMVSFDTSAIGKGMVNLGKGFNKVAENVDRLDAELKAQEKERTKKKKVDPVARHNAEMKYQEFKWSKQKELEDQMQNADAGSVEGFADGFTDKYKEEASAFFSEIPDELKPHYDEKLFSTERSLYGKASKFVHETQKQTSIANIESMRDNTFYEGVSSGKDYNEVVSDFTSLVETNPYLSRVEKDKRIKEGAAKLEEAHIKYRMESGDDFTSQPASPAAPAPGRQASLQPQEAVQEEGKPSASPAPIATQPRSDARSDDDIEASMLAERPLGETSIKGRRLTQPVRTAIETAAAETGVDAQTLTAFAMIESGGNPRSVDVRGGKPSKYKGLFQLSKEEFNKYSDGGDILDANDNARAAARKIKAESAEFEKNNGRIPDATDLYLMHQQGPAGYAAHMANPDKPAWDNMLSTGEGAQKGEKWAKKAIWGNVPDDVKKNFPKGVDSVTSADFVEIWRNRVGSFGKAYGGKQADGGSQGGASEKPAGETAKLPGSGGDAIDLSMYKHLDADKRHKLELMIRKKKTEKYEGEQEELKQMLKDDVESIRDSGVPRADVNIDRAKRVLSKNELYKYETERKRAQMEYTAMSDFDSLPNNQIEQRINSLVPKTGSADYEIADDVYNKAKKRADEVRGLRNRDPAAAADSLPELKPYLKASTDAPDDPKAAQQLVKARLQTQDKLGIALASQSPITDNEAKSIIARTKGLEGKDLTEAVMSLNEELRNKYGDYASMVGTAAIRSEVRDKEIAEELQSQIDRAFKGQPTTPYQKHKLDVLQETAISGKVFGNTEWGMSGQVMGGTAAAGPVRVRTIEEAMALPAGTKFYDPNGTLRTR